MIIRYILFLMLTLLILGCTNKKEFVLFNKVDSNQTRKSHEIQEFTNMRFEYKIMPHDRVSIIIYQHPEFSTASRENRSSDKGILVNSHGDIRLPLVKSVHISGLTQTEALETIESKFTRYLKSPDIYLEVLNKRAYVIGEVRRPGEVSLPNEKLTLLQAISKSGDFTDTANRKAILVLRNMGNKMTKDVVDLTDVNSLTMSNLTIRPNDIVYVVPNDMKVFNMNVNEIDPLFKLIGHVLSPFITIKYLSE